MEEHRGRFMHNASASHPMDSPGVATYEAARLTAGATRYAARIGAIAAVTAALITGMFAVCIVVLQGHFSLEEAKVGRAIVASPLPEIRRKLLHPSDNTAELNGMPSMDVDDLLDVFERGLNELVRCNECFRA
ncbi:hypothetical protein [Micromonospora humida]|uniref:Uncharacterized protein n=1 Tax=Micromonospora humida TaxID=2809018 RepID=A0ABS2IWM0_9ACTN|nr:hypothetical protein [Micromonospora humida]MBM7078341.1 hypothetical protein [Micromonospora humida]